MWPRVAAFQYKSSACGRQAHDIIGAELLERCCQDVHKLLIARLPCCSCKERLSIVKNCLKGCVSFQAKVYCVGSAMRQAHYINCLKRCVSF